MYFRSDGLGEAAPQLTLPPYSPPYPNIKAKDPATYPAALAARNALDKLSWFRNLYQPLMAATGNARLALNQADEIVVIPDESTATALLGEKLMKAVLKQSGKSLIKHLVSEDFARVLGIVDLLFKLHSALSIFDNKRLVSEQNHSRWDDAYRYKLRFFIGVYIDRKAPLADRVRMAWKIEDIFFQYRKAQSEVWKYDIIERNLRAGLPANTPDPPRMYPR